MRKLALFVVSLCLLALSSSSFARKVSVADMRTIRSDAKASPSVGYSSLKRPSLAVLEKKGCRCGDHSIVKVELRSRRVPRARATFHINQENASVTRKGRWVLVGK